MKDDIAVEHGKTDHGEFTTSINDRKANRAWSGVGKTQDEASTEATRRMLGDRRAREYVS